MRLLKFVAVMLLSVLVSPAAFAGSASPTTTSTPLQLFGLELETVDRETLIAAAVSAGAKQIGKKGASNRFDISKLGLPGLKTMIIVFHEGQFVLARYSSEPATKDDSIHFNRLSADDDEALRKMLVAKYGTPQKEGGRYSATPFDGQYISDGQYEWKYRGNMRLVYAKPFFSSAPTELIYANAAMTQKLRAAAEAASTKDAAQRAKAAGSAL